MGRQGNRKKKNKNKRRQPRSVNSSHSRVADDDGDVFGNFVHQAGPGCHIARQHSDGHKASSKADESWVLEWEAVDPDDYVDEDEDEVPDIAIDTEELTLTLCNIRTDHVVAYISIYDTLLLDCKGRALQQGSTTNNQGETSVVTTLIVLCPPLTFAHLCYLDMRPTNENTSRPQVPSLDNLRIESDVQVWSRHPDPSDTHTKTIGFPLGHDGGEEDDVPFYCTQGEGGELTHFFAGNLHAVDFRCAVGTPLLAVADGVVVEVKQTNKLTGISVNNLFEWNSILIRADEHEKNETDKGSNSEPSAQKIQRDHILKDGPLFVEYVHIESASVKAGDKVTKGQVIGTSGSVGFSPEPHLHFAAYRSTEPTAPTVRVYFADSSGTVYLPQAGKWYNSDGLVLDPSVQASNDISTKR